MKLPFQLSIDTGEHLISIPPEFVESLRIRLGEGERDNSFSATLFDPQLLLTNAIAEISFRQGGLATPALLHDAPASDGSANKTPAAPGGGGSSTDADGKRGDDLARVIIQYCLANRVTSRGQVAAVLGTAQIETNMGIFMEELGDAAYLSYLGEDAPFKGRGLVQVTGRYNYQKVGVNLGKGAGYFISNPSALAKMENAIPSLVLGMRDGWYTGKRLSDYEGNPYNFHGSRNIVNPGEGGSRRATYIGYCQEYLGRLDSLGYGKITPTANVKNATLGAATTSGFTKVTAEQVENFPADPEMIKRIHTIFGLPSDYFKEREQTDSGREDLGFVPQTEEKRFQEIKIIFNMSDRISSFWLTEYRASNSVPHKISITGKGLLVRLAKKFVGASSNYQGASLRQLATAAQKQTNVSVKVDSAANPDEVTWIPFSGIASNFLAALGEASRQTGNILQQTLNEIRLVSALSIKKVAPKDLKDDWFPSNFSFTDRANPAAILGSLPDLFSLVEGKIAEGFPASVELLAPTLESATLEPGVAVRINEKLMPTAFQRSFRLQAVDLSYQKGIWKQSLNLYIPVNVKESSASSGKEGVSPTGKTIVQNALDWVGKDFNPGIREQCMIFVRTVLKQSGSAVADKVTAAPWDGWDTGLAFANSLSGSDCGQVISSVAAVRAGDIVFFLDTYGVFQAKPGKSGTITHVGIAVSATEMVDRPTASKPVQRRAIATFNFGLAIRTG